MYSVGDKVTDTVTGKKAEVVEVKQISADKKEYKIVGIQGEYWEAWVHARRLARATLKRV